MQGLWRHPWSAARPPALAPHLWRLAAIPMHLRGKLTIRVLAGLPSDGKGPTLVFNGDFVDRGAHQVEVAQAFVILL
eukprot:3271264-Amphidinium_carterae.1